jgi:purine-nucleoside phosphorylase
MFNKIKEAADFLAEKTNNFKPKSGVILGTGLGDLVGEVDVEYEIDYENIPHFVLSTLESHKGKLIFGKLDTTPVVVMQGRFHYYEGYDLSQVAFPVRVMKLLGIENLFVSNASGGLDPSFKKGDLMIINDHINQFPGNPLVGKNIDELGGRFPDMSEPYDRGFIKAANKIAKENNINVQNGVYVGLPGPMLETPAEYKYLSIIGANAVGMSTVPEIIAAKHMELPCFACSIITDICYGEIKPVNIQDIISVAMNAQPQLTLLFKKLINKIQ